MNRFVPPLFLYIDACIMQHLWGDPPRVICV